MNLVIRPLTAEDAPRYHAFRLEGLRRYPHAFRSSYEDEAQKPASWAVARLAASPANPHGFALGAFDGAELVGTIVLETTARAKLRHCADVIGMLVDERYAGRGVGAALLHQLVARARAIAGLESLHLTVTDGNDRAIALYERFGFEREGVERRVLKLGGRYYDKLHMRLDLRHQP
jgi:RimJ/RimL family protein N-acetyltransferase